MEKYNGIVYFEVYSKKELSSLEQMWVKYYPDKYKLGFRPTKKDVSDTKDILERMAEAEEIKHEKEIKKVWKCYAKYKKNPKKYNKKENKTERMLLKYFEIQNEKNMSKKHKGKLAKIIDAENKLSKQDVFMYYKIKEHQNNWDNINSTKKYIKNPNKKYNNIVRERVEDEFDEHRISILKSLEEELLSHLQDPIEMVKPHNIAWDFKEKVVFNESNKKSKKKKKIDIANTTL